MNACKVMSVFLLIHCTLVHYFWWTKVCVCVVDIVTFTPRIRTTASELVWGAYPCKLPRLRQGEKSDRKGVSGREREKDMQGDGEVERWTSIAKFCAR